MGADVLRPKKGLEGVVFDQSAISKAMPEEKKLIYRGYPVHELATMCRFEEVAYLLLHDDLPNQMQLEKFVDAERSQREISPSLVASLKLYPKTGHSMDRLRTAISFLGLEEQFIGATLERDVLYPQAVALLAKTATIVAYDYRIRNGLDLIAPRADLGYAENFFHMCFGNVPSSEIVKAFDASLTLYAEHGFNASTFTARVIVSSLSDLIAGVTGGIGSLKGPLHGGANEAVVHMLLEVGSIDDAERWVLDALQQKKKIMGFGHRLYRFGDSRVPTMTYYRDEVARLSGDNKLGAVAKKVEEVMIREKKIYPNLDFPAGPTYYMMGFEIPLFTPIFVMARVVGWSAHVMEQLADNRLVRPLSEYSGAGDRAVVALASRSL